MHPFFSFIVAIMMSLVSVGADVDRSVELATQITNEMMIHGEAYQNLSALVAGGPRLSGSKQAAAAVQWAENLMKNYGFDRVWTQSVQVPRWERGRIETASVQTASGWRNLRVTALGNSVGTNSETLESEVIELQNLADVKANADRVRGHIVFFSRAMDPSHVDTFDAYGEASDQRLRGASEAARYGAVGVLVRSLSLSHDAHPHTGVVIYSSSQPKIPAAALSTLDADILSQELKARGVARVRMALSAQQFAPVTSYNVIGEMRGSERPNEVVVVGGHLDSWDLGVGAHDDGAGVVHSIEVLRVIKALHLHPRRTVRAVLFMSEEFGAQGAEEYARYAQSSGEHHIAAIESDRGGFSPRGFEVDGTPEQLKWVQGFSRALSVMKADAITSGFGGTDVDELKPLGTALIGFVPDSQRYFDVHHAETDQLSAVNPRELQLGAAAIATLAIELANSP